MKIRYAIQIFLLFQGMFSIAYAQTINLPQTGQATSYYNGDDGYEQQGVSFPNPRFSENGNGTVRDNLTGLIWIKNANCINMHYSEYGLNGYVTFQEGLEFIAGMNNGLYQECSDGLDGWRMPNINELLSLIDHNSHSPALAVNHPFIPGNLGTYHTSTVVAHATNSVRVVSFANGNIASARMTNRYPIWPVKGESGAVIALPKTGQTVSYHIGDDGTHQKGVLSWAVDRFDDSNGDGTVKDNLTGLTWSKTIFPAHTWEQSFQYIEDMNAGLQPNFGYTDWRMPNIIEIMSLYDHGRARPYLNSSHKFLNVPNAHIWSSTTDPLDSAKAFSGSLWHAEKTSGAKSTNRRVWTVRGTSIPQSDLVDLSDMVVPNLKRKLTFKRKRSFGLTLAEVVNSDLQDLNKAQCYRGALEVVQVQDKSDYAKVGIEAIAKGILSVSLGQITTGNVIGDFLLQATTKFMLSDDDLDQTVLEFLTEQTIGYIFGSTADKFLDGATGGEYSEKFVRKLIKKEEGFKHWKLKNDIGLATNELGQYYKAGETPLTTADINVFYNAYTHYVTATVDADCGDDNVYLVIRYEVDKSARVANVIEGTEEIIVVDSLSSFQ